MTSRLGALAFLTALAVLAAFNAAYAGTGAPEPWQFDLPQAATPIMEGIRKFNVLLGVIIVSIVTLVLLLLAWVVFRYRESANPTPSQRSHNTTIEVIWTIVPVLVLVVIAIPSFRLLYEQFSFPKADVTIKATGKQWFWSYEYPDFKNVSFDSYPIDDKDLKPGQLRLLSVDNEVVVPVNKVVQVFITGADVIHQWVVPAFGSRADAIPGRMNRTWFLIKEPGVYYGQCSALCGNGHAFMPIAVRAVSEEDFQKWIEGKQQSASANHNRLAEAQAAMAR